MTTTKTTGAAAAAAEAVVELLRELRLPHMRHAAPDLLATAKAQRWDPAEAVRASFLSPNKRTNLAHYPDRASQAAATALVEAQSLSFDLSDQLPVSFGGTPGHGMFRRLQEFLYNPADVEGVSQRLQDDFQAATRSSAPG